MRHSAERNTSGKRKLQKFHADFPLC
jgi:hypothetical protein